MVNNDEEIRKSLKKRKSTSFDPEKYYLAKAYMIVADSMINLDEYNSRDQGLL